MVGATVGCFGAVLLLWNALEWQVLWNEEIGNERENDVAAFVCCGCFLKQNILYGAYAVIPFTIKPCWMAVVDALAEVNGFARHVSETCFILLSSYIRSISHSENLHGLTFARSGSYGRALSEHNRFQSKRRIKILVLFFDFVVAENKFHECHDLPRLRPTKGRFKSSMGKIIVRPDFMSEKLLRKDSCKVRGTMEELAPTPFACAVFEAECAYITFFESGNVTSKVPVLSKKHNSDTVLSSLKVRLRFCFLNTPKTASTNP